MGIDKSIGCNLNDSAKLPFINAKNALVIPQDGQIIPVNFFTRQPVPKNHIAIAEVNTPINMRSRLNTVVLFIELLFCTIIKHFKNFNACCKAICKTTLIKSIRGVKSCVIEIRKCVVKSSNTC